jgi:hypothetical protein
MKSLVTSAVFPLSKRRFLNTLMIPAIEVGFFRAGEFA